MKNPYLQEATKASAGSWCTLRNCVRCENLNFARELRADYLLNKKEKKCERRIHEAILPLLRKCLSSR